MAYLRQHPWQRRAVTLLLATVAGLGLGRFSLYPWHRNRSILADLDSTDAATRQAAIERAAAVARYEEAFRRLLIDRLDASSDRQFGSVVQVLNLLGESSPLMLPRHIFRHRRVRYAEALPAPEAIAQSIQPRDDPHAAFRRSVIGQFVRQRFVGDEAAKLLRLSVDDPDEGVRSEAALLAVMCSADEQAKAFLTDLDCGVRTRTITALALAGRTDILSVQELEYIWRLAQDEQEVAATALAMALTDPSRAAHRITARLATAQPESLRDKLYWTICLLPAEHFDPTNPSLNAGQSGSPMPLLLAGHHCYAAEAVRSAMIEPWQKQTLTVRDASRQAAAAWAARKLNLHVSAEMDRLLRNLYEPLTATTMMQSALTLAHAATLEAKAYPDRAEGIRQRAAETLEAASAVSQVPLAAAAAAFALWQLDAPAGQAAILRTACAEATLAGDWLAWHVASRDCLAARQIARQLLEVPYINNAKAAGAMMLALASRNDPAAAAEARGLIEERAGPADDPRVRDAYLLESYNCALLLLGQKDLTLHVRGLLMAPEFPQRRLLTALLLSGDAAACEWLLANEDTDAAQLDYLLGNKMLSEVLTAALPDLPTYQPLASPAVRLWQAQIILDAYALRSTKLN